MFKKIVPNYFCCFFLALKSYDVLDQDNDLKSYQRWFCETPNSEDG